MWRSGGQGPINVARFSPLNKMPLPRHEGIAMLQYACSLRTLRYCISVSPCEVHRFVSLPTYPWQCGDNRACPSLQLCIGSSWSAISSQHRLGCSLSCLERSDRKSHPHRASALKEQTLYLRRSSPCMLGHMRHAGAFAIYTGQLSKIFSIAGIAHPCTKLTAVCWLSNSSFDILSCAGIVKRHRPAPAAPLWYASRGIFGFLAITALGNLLGCCLAKHRT